MGETGRQAYLSPEEQLTLLGIARQSLERLVKDNSQYSPDLISLSPKLAQPGASFVTLTIKKELRGCIGSIEPIRALALDVAINTQNSAARDPRFYPVVATELPGIKIEISVLTPMEKVNAHNQQERLAAVVPHRDGIMLVYGYQRGLLLPQVWEKIPDKERFFEQLCYKARLPKEALDLPELEMYKFEVECFEERAE